MHFYFIFYEKKKKIFARFFFFSFFLLDCGAGTRGIYATWGGGNRYLIYSYLTILIGGKMVLCKEYLPLHLQGAEAAWVAWK